MKQMTELRECFEAEHDRAIHAQAPPSLAIECGLRAVLVRLIRQSDTSDELMRHVRYAILDAGGDDVTVSVAATVARE
ncbi:MAG: hypothetical protein NVS1B14_11650 [Vulcanimicrobiaceae bacterium]